MHSLKLPARLFLTSICVVSVSLLVSCDDDDKVTHPITSLEQAKLVAASFNPVKNSIDLQLEGVSTPSNFDFDIDGINGKAEITGAGSVLHIDVMNCGETLAHNASMEFNLSDYSSSDYIALNGSGEVKFASVTPEHNDPACTYTVYDTESVKFAATGISVLLTGVKATIQDEVEINFVYNVIFNPRINEGPKESVHYYLKTSEGKVFEWDE
jgi:hypothetical protein